MNMHTTLIVAILLGVVPLTTCGLDLYAVKRFWNVSGNSRCDGCADENAAANDCVALVRFVIQGGCMPFQGGGLGSERFTRIPNSTDICNPIYGDLTCVGSDVEFITSVNECPEEYRISTDKCNFFSFGALQVQVLEDHCIEATEPQDPYTFPIADSRVLETKGACQSTEKSVAERRQAQHLGAFVDDATFCQTTPVPNGATTVRGSIKSYCVGTAQVGEVHTTPDCADPEPDILNFNSCTSPAYVYHTCGKPTQVYCKDFVAAGLGVRVAARDPPPPPPPRPPRGGGRGIGRTILAYHHHALCTCFRAGRILNGVE